MIASHDDLKEISEELAGIDYGELHIQIRAGEIISYSTIKSRLNKKRLTNNPRCAKAESVQGSGVIDERATAGTLKK